MVRTADEIIQTQPSLGYAFVDRLSHPLEIGRRPYFGKAWMAGRFFPSPYSPPLDRVKVKSGWWSKTQYVREKPVPADLSHYPQYADGVKRVLEEHDQKA